ncbi:acyl-CoA N-acyltransferase [Pleurotus eryngii]|uniref:Acyl-CoA N-acyltransferase n=1 Tax=Pleurotus eryngii TaxID=5323 RepID=A0A9P5ZW58_PLEER|nr:acyl-CoA N-acyltransferase [Pleurotus eryngii]
MSTPSKFHIRAAKLTDVETILQLIYELATYEKEPESAKATPQLLERNLFGDTPVAHALLAVSGTEATPGPPIGLALYFFNFSTWTGRPGLYLEDLYVKPELRGQGIGKALFGELSKVAREKDCARMDWSVLKWNQPSIDFYEKSLGAKPMSEWLGMRLDEQGIEGLSEFVTK